MEVRSNKLHMPDLIGDVATLVDATIQGVGIYHQKVHVLSEMNKSIACDITKAKTVLGYAPKIALRESMRRSVEWCLAIGQTIWRTRRNRHWLRGRIAPRRQLVAGGDSRNWSTII